MNRVEERIQKEGRPLVGVAVHTHNTAFVEMAGLLGFHILWIEMEHGLLNYEKVADICRIASGVGLLTMIRIPDARRESVLKAAECGPDVIDLPMGNSPEILRDLVVHARYAPDGNRGVFGSSRAVRYGLNDSIVDEQMKINGELCLVAQVETREAVGCVDSLCGVSGIDGIFIGPADLSASLGVLHDTKHHSVREATDHVIKTAKEHCKLVFYPGGPMPPDAQSKIGADVLFCGSDMSCIKSGLRSIIEQLRG